MKKQPIIFLALVALALCSFAIFKGQEAAAPPIEKAVYKQYLSLFTKVELPYKMSIANETWKEKEELDMNYAPFIPDLEYAQFSRSEPSDYYPEVMVAADKKFNIVVYAEVVAWHDDRPHFHIQTINKKGKVISSFYLVKFAKESDSYCEIAKDLSISTYDAETKKTQKLKIDKEGKISEVKAG
jgi:hypothetical protein